MLSFCSSFFFFFLPALEGKEKKKKKHNQTPTCRSNPVKYTDYHIPTQTSFARSPLSLPRLKYCPDCRPGRSFVLYTLCYFLGFEVREEILRAFTTKMPHLFCNFIIQLLDCKCWQSSAGEGFFFIPLFMTKVIFVLQPWVPCSLVVLSYPTCLHWTDFPVLPLALVKTDCFKGVRKMEFEYFVLLSVDSLQHINCFAIIMVGGKRCLRDWDRWCCSCALCTWLAKHLISATKRRQYKNK